MEREGEPIYVGQVYHNELRVRHTVLSGEVFLSLCTVCVLSA